MMVAHIFGRTQSCSLIQSYLVYILVVIESSRISMDHGLGEECVCTLLHNLLLGHSRYLQCISRTFQYQCCILTILVERILGRKRSELECTPCPLLGHMVRTFQFLGCTWHVAFHRWRHRRQQCCNHRHPLYIHRISWCRHCI